MTGPINEPKGVQKPYPSLWIGGSGEQVTLKLVAQYGNACNIGGTPDTIRHKLEVLRTHCETAGRAYEDIIRSSNMGIFLIKPGEDPEKATETARRATGISYELYAQNVKIGTPDEIRRAIAGASRCGYQLCDLLVPPDRLRP